jgi:protein-glutamine gamma-glutamyltransferase
MKINTRTWKEYIMIQLSGMPFQQSDLWSSGSIESMIIQRMIEDTVVYSYQFIGELSFELNLRKNIILSARAMNQSNVRFERFANSRCNPQYWHLTSTGGFLLRQGVKLTAFFGKILYGLSLFCPLIRL